MKKAVSQFITIVLTAALSFGCGFLGSYARSWLVDEGYIGEPAAREENERPQTETPAVNINLKEDMTIGEAVASKVMPSVVGVSTTFEASYGGGFFDWGLPHSYEAGGVGTGVIVDSAGYILTNSHVVNDGDLKSLKVSLFDGSSEDAELLWHNPILDLAVIKIDGKGKKLVSAELGDSDELNVGAYAAAIGNPLGLAFERSMSQGIISGLNRRITVGNENTGDSVTMEGLIQTDATINSGNSGGPLLNSLGQVIGINSAKASNGEGMGFAIPINVAKPIVSQIMETGSYNRPYLGITGIGLEEQRSYSNDELKEYFGTTTGIYVYAATEGGGAQAAGLQKGDIIVEINGVSVGTMNKLNTQLVKYEPGDSVKLKVMRDKTEKEYEVKLTGELASVTDREPIPEPRK